ncbi:hypothetical protein [Chitinophaga terrae (ex Kim and Jung 2007)]|nr:hypothetical protein [Chitinophaga terrae (ex Kim and Jung 2007)]
MLPEDPNDKWYPEKYYLNQMQYNSYTYKPDTVTTVDYYGTDSLVHKITYKYENMAHLLPTTATEIVSYAPGTEGYLKRFKYPQDIASITNPALSSVDSTNIRKLEQLHIWDQPIEQETYKDGVFQFKQRTDFATWTGGLVLPSRQKIKLGTYNVDTVSTVYQYDQYGNVLQQANDKDILLSYIWDYNSQQAIAEVSNAAYSDIAYTSFEAEGSGNWIIPSALRNTTSGATGQRSFDMSNAGATGITKSGLQAGTTYKVSYFTKNSVPVTISGTQGAVTKGNTIAGGWTYYEHRVSGVTSVKITGAGLIDELRLHPESAQMVTATYTPLVGQTSSCNARGQVAYFEYDAANRLKLVKDQDGKILKLYDYQYRAPLTR